MKTFAVVHNIPSPYRLHLFDVLGERLRANNIEFHVHFMAHLHQDRPHWDLKGKGLSFSHSFWPDVGPTIRGMRWHLNPGLVKALMDQPTDYLLVGGLWDSFTNILVSALARRTVGIAWIEGNTKTTGRINGIFRMYKQMLLHRYQFVAVPGIEGNNYVQLILRNTNSFPHPVFLPNIVDERKFVPGGEVTTATRQAMRDRFGLEQEDRVAVWPARLVAAKGVVEFLSLLTPQVLKGWKILLLGEGPLRQEVERTISSQGLERNVVLRTYVSYDEMPEIYASFDLFLLASVTDPNPLSVVEAMHSGLPILVSDRIGNYPEAYRKGVNGWSFDPLQKENVQAAAHLAFSAPIDQLREMGRKSQHIAAEFWGSVNAVDRFLTNIMGAAAPVS